MVSAGFGVTVLRLRAEVVQEVCKAVALEGDAELVIWGVVKKVIHNV